MTRRVSPSVRAATASRAPISTRRAASATAVQAIASCTSPWRTPSVRARSARSSALSAPKVSMTRSAVSISASCSSASFSPKRCIAVPRTSSAAFLRPTTRAPRRPERRVIAAVERGRARHLVGQPRRRRDQPDVALGGAARQQAGDQQPVDLVGAFEDAVDAGVAVAAFGRVVADEAVAAVDLHVLVDHVVGGLAAGDLGDRRLDGVLLERRQQPRRRRAGAGVDGAIDQVGGPRQQAVEHVDAAPPSSPAWCGWRRTRRSAGRTAAARTRRRRLRRGWRGRRRRWPRRASAGRSSAR